MISLEVLEHVESSKRGTLIAEVLRVAQHGVVLTCPNGSDFVQMLEKLVSDSYHRRHGVPHPFLIEHKEYGLPKEHDVRAIFTELQIPHVVFSNAPVDIWLPMLLLSENLAERGILSQFQGALAAGVRSGRIDSHGPPYRKIYVGIKSPDAVSALTLHLSNALLPQQSDDSITSAALLHNMSVLSAEGFANVAGMLSTLEAETARWKAQCAEQQQAFEARVSQLANAEANRTKALQVLHVKERQQAQQEMQALIARIQNEQARLRLQRDEDHQLHARLIDAVYRSPSWKFTRGFRWLHRLLFNTRHEIDYQLSKGLRCIGAGHTRWEALAPDPYFVIPGPISTGTLRLRLKLQHVRKTCAYLWFDEGNGFVPSARILLAKDTNTIELTRKFTIKRPLRALKFEPVDSQGEFALEKFEIERLATLSSTSAASVQNALATAVDLRPAHQLAKGPAQSQSDAWVSTGNDPQFHISRKIPRGQVEVELEMEASVPSRAQLYFDTGRGFNSTEHVTLGRFRARASFIVPVKLINDVTAVRFDPLDKPGTFVIHRFEIRNAATHAASSNTVTQSDLFPMHEIESLKNAGEYESTGYDPQFVANCSLAPGWYCADLTIAAERGGSATLYLDSGGDFNAVERVDMGGYSGQSRSTRYFRTTAPVCGVRLDPLEYPATFRILNFSIRRCSPLRVLAKVLRHFEWNDLAELGRKIMHRPIGRSVALKTWLKNKLFWKQSCQFSNYHHWRETRRITPAIRQQYRSVIIEELVESSPRISVLMPVYNLSPEGLPSQGYRFRGPPGLFKLGIVHCGRLFDGAACETRSRTICQIRSPHQGCLP